MSRRRKKKVSSKAIVGVAMGSAGIAAVMGLVWLLFLASSRYEGIDQETFCPREKDRYLAIVLIDGTDGFNPIQQISIRNELNKLREEVPEFGRISIYVVYASSLMRLKPTLSVCNPGNPEDASEFTSSKSIVEKRWRESFEAPLNTLFNQVLDDQGDQGSPLMESFQAASLTAFGKQVGLSTKTPARLIIVSDMLHHTPQLSMYRNVPRFSSFRKANYYRKVMSDMTGVDVEVLLVRRDAHTKTSMKDLVDFWNSYFTDQGGRLTRWKNIEG